jgi:hypothetical protein
MCAASALAKLTNGVVFDEAENRLLPVDGAIELARRNLEALLQPEPELRPGTRPADIKRYVKPLLKQRSDLVLRGRLLIVRPVRHLLRGVLFDRTSDKYRFQLWRYINRLYGSPNTVGCGDSVYSEASSVWQPQFHALLMDCLAEDMFDLVGEVTTLDAFAESLRGNEDFISTRVTALLLAGKRDEATQLVAEIERAYPDHHYWPEWSRLQRQLLARDSKEICAEFHAREAKTAKALKLGDIWEPSPFPVEVPEAERNERCADPCFTTTPWIARPPGLVQEVPEQPGEVRFAESAVWRKGRVVLLVALTREEAEEKHRTRQDYVLATRLPGGNVLVLDHHTGWSPHDPFYARDRDYVPTRSFRLNVHGPSGRSQIFFEEHYYNRGVVELWSVMISDHVGHNKQWQAHNDFRSRDKAIHDSRAGRRGFELRPLTPSDMSLYLLGEPPFGEFEDLWRRAEQYLENEGFGRFT